MPSAKRKLGDLGENIACSFLENRGFEIVERNYLRKWGEIDIVARKAGVIHFVEVKSVSTIILGNSNSNSYRPEDNMHHFKLKRLGRVMQTYILDKKLDFGPASGVISWQLDLITVKMDHAKRKARVEILENVII